MKNTSKLQKGNPFCILDLTIYWEIRLCFVDRWIEFTIEKGGNNLIVLFSRTGEK